MIRIWVRLRSRASVRREHLFGPRWPLWIVMMIAAFALAGGALWATLSQPVDCSQDDQPVVPLNILQGPEHSIDQGAIMESLRPFHNSGIGFDLQFSKEIDLRRVNIKFGSSLAVSGRTENGAYVILCPSPNSCVPHELGHGLLLDWFRARLPGTNLVYDWRVDRKLTRQAQGFPQTSFRCGAAALTAALRSAP